MTQHDDAIEKLTLMVNDTESLSLFRHNGPLAWFSPDATFSGATSRSALSDKQCKLIVDVFAQYLHFKSTSARFLKTIECSELTLKLQQLQKAKPKCETSNLKSISQRLATVVQALFGRWTFHIGHLDEAEKIVGELPLEGRLSVWQMVQGARLAYLCQLYESSST